MPSPRRAPTRPRPSTGRLGSRLLRVLNPVAPPADPEPPPRQIVCTPGPHGRAGAAIIASTRPGDEPPTPRAVVVASPWRTPAGVALVLASRSDPPAAPSDDTPPRPLVYAPTRPREGLRVILAVGPRTDPVVVADDTRVPVPLVVVPVARPATTRPIVTWTRTDPDTLPRPLVLTTSTRRTPGVALSLRSSADPPVVAEEIAPWPALVVTRRTPAGAGVVVVLPHLLVGPDTAVGDGLPSRSGGDQPITGSATSTGKSTSRTGGRDESGQPSLAVIDATHPPKFTSGTWTVIKSGGQR